MSSVPLQLIRATGQRAFVPDMELTEPETLEVMKSSSVPALNEPGQRAWNARLRFHALWAARHQSTAIADQRAWNTSRFHALWAAIGCKAAEYPPH